MQDFRNLKVWEKAHATLRVYHATQDFPEAEPTATADGLTD
jgi:hypothetical protein